MAAEITRGLYDCRINTISSGVVSATSVDCPRVRSLDMTGESDSTQIEGDDVVLEVTSLDEKITWDLEMAGLSLAFMAAVEGVTTLTSGTGGSTVVTLQKTDATIRPAFQLRGQSKSKDGGALVVTLHNSSMTSGPNMTLEYGEYNRPSMSGESTYNDATPRVLYSLAQQTTFTALT